MILRTFHHRFFLLLCVCWVLPVHAQLLIAGKVTDDEDHPLAKASVFVNSSTVGTTTGADGSFRLQVDFAGVVELVVSHVGYEPLLYRLDPGDANKRFVFRLQPQAQTLRNVVVLSDAMRKKWMQVFRDNFLGITEAGRSCRILNEEDIQFTSGGAGVIGAYSEQPLVVVNRELGYRIHFRLVDFIYDGNRTFFVGYPRFEELTQKTAQKKARIRGRYYEGSSVHFFRSLINRSTAQEGFTMRLLKQAVSPVALEADTAANAKKPAAFAGRVVYAQPVTADSIISAADTLGLFAIHRLRWEGRLQVNYSKDPVAKAFLSQQMQSVGAPGRGITSFLELQEPFALMDGKGWMVTPLALAFGGYWSYEKLGAMLPADYYVSTRDDKKAE